MTIRQYKQNCEAQISLYKDYLLTRGVDAKHRTIAWAIQERDAIDEDNLITEISRLSEIVKELRLRSIIDKALLDETIDFHTEELETTFNKTQIYAPN